MSAAQLRASRPFTASTDINPEPLRNELKAELRDYANYVIDKDCPAHRRGIAPEGGEHRLQVIGATLRLRAGDLLHPGAAEAYNALDLME